MAKKSGGPNKSAAIRDYVTANPQAKPKEIVDAMKSQGITVSTAFVSTIKSKTVGAGSKKKGRKAGRPKGTVRAAGAATATATPAAKAARNGGTVSVEQLLKAKKLAGELGGVGKARAALEALERIMQ